MLPAVRERVADMGATDTWQDVAALIVQATGMSESEAEMAMSKAYGWTGWYQMNCPDYMKPKLPPHPSKVQDALKWLQDGPLRLNPEEMRHAVEKEAKFYIDEPMKSYWSARSTAPDQFKAPDSFREVLVREPHALGLTYNCLDTDPATRPVLELGEPLPCDGQCKKCWRTHTPKLMGEILHGADV
jgi:hypothetical protein